MTPRSIDAPVRAERLFERLTLEQRAFVESDSPALCAVAAAGSGKTAAVAARVVRLVRSGIDPAQVRVFVFTRAARAEIRARAVEYLGTENADRVDIATFHGFACRVLGVAPASEEVSEAYLRSLYDGPTRRRGIPGIEAVRSGMIDHESGRAPLDADVSRALGILGQRMEETGALPMWDALPRAEAELEDPETLARHARKHVIVDEAQDVAVREERVARMVGEQVATVGDPRQAIMGFRGALGMCGAHVYAHTYEQTHGPECLALSKSFRFGPNIAAFATALCGGRTRPTWGSVEIEDAVRFGATDDDAVAALRPKPAGAAVLCRTHDECDFAARRLSNLGLRVHYAGRREPGDERSDPFAEAVAQDAAAVSTIHGAKGREFDAVYVPSSDIGPREGGDDPMCAYVAATRARRLLLWGGVKWAMR